MKTKEKIKAVLKKKILILDGATGTELQKRDMPGGVCPEEWCCAHPDVLESIHAAYAYAGSDVVYTCTFGANKFKLAQYGITDVFGVNKELAQCARRAVKKSAFIAGNIGPTGHFVHPFGAVPFEEAVEAFKEQVHGLLAGGVDLFVIETMMDIQEARAALIAVKDLTQKFVIVTMAYERDGRTLNGTDPRAALVTMQSLGADAVGCNCSAGPQDMLPIIKDLKTFATVFLVAKPNAGLPRLVNNKTVFDMNPQKFASFAHRFAAEGANLMGGCCGTTPDHIRELKKELADIKPIFPLRHSLSAVSSARKAVVLKREHGVYVVGERINPTGKKKLQAELHKAKMSLIRAMAREQTREGADLLDVNVGMPGINEKDTMHEVVSLLATVTECPLVIDSSDFSVVEAALRIYPGRALINSISAEKGKMKKLFLLAKKYGAMCILLPITEKELPQIFAGRKEIIKSLIKQAQKHGMTKDDVVVDALAMAVSSSPDAAIETLKTVEWCRNTGCIHTIVGLSNISFGLPQRKRVNAAFLALARARGLSMAIMNPREKDVAVFEKATDVLTGKDKGAKAYIAWCGHAQAQKTSLQEKQVYTVFDCIVEGDKDGIIPLIDKALKEGTDVRTLLNEVMIPAITHVGELFDKKEYFLPQLIAGAETMKKGFEYLKPRTERETMDISKKIVVLLATVEGDIHDIGKNIVALLLRNHGFYVINLGCDISAQRLIKEIKRYKPAIVGLSALMTTTMVNMEEVIELARQKGLKCKFIVGGAVVTRAYAESLNAEYAKDGVEAVRVVERLTE